MLFWDGLQHYPVASEGGHCDFAPRNDQEINLLKYLMPKFGGHVSYERLLSGSGFYNIYQFLRDTGFAPEPQWLAERLPQGDPSVTITQTGLAGECPLCVETCNLFCRIYGAKAGNLALTCMAIGGVFLGGGIAPKILRALENGMFVEAFTHKGRFSRQVFQPSKRYSRQRRIESAGAVDWGGTLFPACLNRNSEQSAGLPTCTSLTPHSKGSSTNDD